MSSFESDSVWLWCSSSLKRLSGKFKINVTIYYDKNTGRHDDDTPTGFEDKRHPLEKAALIVMSNDERGSTKR
jgi:hypothetical protein